MQTTLRKPTRPVDRAALRGELLKLLALAVLFALVMLATTWVSVGLPIAGR
jgi:hypothetical protein